MRPIPNKSGLAPDNITLADAGVAVPSGKVLDGENLLPLCKKSGIQSRSSLFWHFPGYLNALVKENNLAANVSTKANELLDELFAWIKNTDAPIPDQPNPNYNPQAAAKALISQSNKKRSRE